jgi:putative addiction module component (TIGR02574 family)
MTSKAILEEALKLPIPTRARLAGKLLDSLDEAIWEEAMITGAKIAERRLRDLRSGKTKGIPEAEAHRRLFGKKKS